MTTAECRSAMLRALLAAAALTYLICVLVLSGMQKEDLDVSMLRKLERYNVNIDDMNNEQKRQECTERSTEFSNGYQRHNGNNDYISTTEKTTTEDTFKTLSVAVLNYLKSRQKTNLYTSTSKYIPQEIDASATENFENQPNININLLQRYIQQKANRSASKPEQTYESINPYRMDRNTDSKIEPSKLKGVRDDGFIDNVFKDYLYQIQVRPTTTEIATTKHIIDILSVYKQIDELIKNGSNKDVEREKTSRKFLDNVTQYNLMPQNQMKSEKGQQIQSIYDFLTTVNQFKAYSSKDFPQNNNTTYSNKDVRIVEKTNEINSPNDHVKYEEIRPNKPEPSIEIKSKALSSDLVKEIAETVKDVIIKDLRNELSNIHYKPTNIIITTTPSTTTTTTMTTTTTTTETPLTMLTNIKEETTKEKELAIMDAFMELYEQIKALKQTTFVLKVHNKSDTIDNDFIQKSNTPAKSQPIIDNNEFSKPETIIPIMPVRNYNTKQYTNLDPYLPRKIKNHRLPITIQTNSIEIRPLAVPVSKPENLIRQNIVVNSAHNIQSREHHAEQSSSRENRYPYMRLIHKNKTDKYTPMKRYEGYNIASNPMHFGYQDLRHDDVIRFTMENKGNSNFDTDYYEKINFRNYKPTNNGRIMKINGNSNINGDYYKKINVRDYKTAGNGQVMKNTGNSNINTDHYEKINFGTDKTSDNRQRMNNRGNSNIGSNYYEKLNFGDYKIGENRQSVDFGNRIIPRYHQKFERLDDKFIANSDKDIGDKRERSNDDVPERQQMSLIDMKKGTAYDDTHFKNFLKTQQKVTDILEKILANRPKTNTIRSVEVA